MTLYHHDIFEAPSRGSAGLAAEILKSNPVDRLFGVFTSQIGLSVNHVVVISRAGGVISAPGATGVERHEIWEADPRPTPGETFPETDGFFSHRWFDVAEADWPRFRELSINAWDNFEGVHDTRVIGFWRSHTPPRAGHVRVWLMAWYKTLAAWEGSRWYLNGDRTDAALAYANFRARNQITVDSAVSLLRRVC